MRIKIMFMACLAANSVVASHALGDVHVESDLSYKTTGSDYGDVYEKERCKLDLYLPTGGEAIATLVWFHGGGLVVGDKANDETRRVCRCLASRGISVAAPNYRLSPKATFPAYVEDAAAATAWVKNHGARFGANTDSVFVGGYSAGGYLATMLSVNKTYLATHEIESSELLGFISISGQTDSPKAILAERGIARDASIVDESAPLFYVANKTAPMLIVVGERDAPRRKAKNLQFASDRRNLGQSNTSLVLVPDRTHASIIDLIDQPGDQVATQMVDFIWRNAARARPIAQHFGTTRPLHRLGGIYLTGQPSPTDLKLFQERGVQTVICLRSREEIDWDEAAAVEQLGMKFVRVPIGGVDSLTDEAFKQVLPLLRRADKEPVLLHCASANRTGPFFAAHRSLADGIDLEQAIAEARKTGLRNPAYVQRAREYVNKRRKGAQ